MELLTDTFFSLHSIFDQKHSTTIKKQLLNFCSSSDLFLPVFSETDLEYSEESKDTLGSTQ